MYKSMYVSIMHSPRDMVIIGRVVSNTSLHATAENMAGGGQKADQRPGHSQSIMDSNDLNTDNVSSVSIKYVNMLGYYIYARIKSFFLLSSMLTCYREECLASKSGHLGNGQSSHPDILTYSIVNSDLSKTDTQIQ